MNYKLIYFALNIVSFSITCFDKYLAIHHKRRISEARLLIHAIFFGALGTFVAMYLIRHKTKHPLFYLTVPLLAVLQLLFTLRY